MKPTHWWNPKYPTMPNQLTAPNEGGGWEASYSADQLREAQVKMLREAADDAEKYIDYPIDEEDITFYGHLEFMVRHLRRMADDLEKKTCGRCNTQPTYKHASGFPLCIDCYNDLTVNERKTES